MRQLPWRAWYAQLTKYVLQVLVWIFSRGAVIKFNLWWLFPKTSVWQLKWSQLQLSQGTADISWLHSGSKCCSSFCPWLVCHVMNPFSNFRYQLSRFIQLLDRYVRFWTRCRSTMDCYVALCGEYNIARDILSWSVSFFFQLTHSSSRLSGMIYKMDPFLMPRPFCIGLSCGRDVSSPSLVDILMIAQPIFISVGAYMIAGTSGAISVATSLAVLKPKTWGDGGRYAHYIDHWCSFLTGL